MFALEYLAEQLRELVKWTVRVGARLVLCSNALPLQVVLEIGRCEAVISANAIGSKFTFIDQTTDRDWIDVKQLCNFLGSHKMFHASSLFRAKDYYEVLCITMNTIYYFWEKYKVINKR